MSEDSNQSNDDKTSDLESKLTQASRRQVLTGVLAGSAVAATTWHKPIINAVMLPAHAQTSSDADADNDTDQDVDDTVTDNEEPTLVDFFATSADASEIGVLGRVILDTLIPAANALKGTNEEPLTDLKFEAEALDQGNGEYKIRIAAERIADQNGRQVIVSRDFVFGWEGTLTNLNSSGLFAGTGCAQNESAQITALSNASLTLEMSYFSKNIQLILDAGSTSLPSFPLNCV